ncbi:MAG: BamA/TamA family outer membrane protein [Myxococcota bacterium]
MTRVFLGIVLAVIMMTLPNLGYAQDSELSSKRASEECSALRLFGATVRQSGLPEDAKDIPKRCHRNDGVALPVVVFAPETSLRFGAFALLLMRRPETDHLPQPSLLRLSLTYTLRNQLFSFGQWRGLFDRGKWLMAADWDLLSAPDFFYGVGPNTQIPQFPDLSEDEAQARTFDRLSFDEQRISVLSAARRAIGDPKDSMYIGILSDFTAVRMGAEPGSILAESTDLVGASGGVRNGLGLDFYWDQRDSGLNARDGFFIEARAIGYSRLLGSSFDYSRLFLDLRGYKSVFRKHTFAARAVGDFGRGAIPWFDLARLGGASLGRGHYAGRYRDKTMVALMGEYRSPPIWRLRGTIFSSLGAVSPAIRELDLRDDVRAAYGAGMRLRIVDGIEFRLDYARSSDQSGLYLNFNEAW